MPHPFDRMHSVPDYEHLLGILDDIDAIEVYNPRVAIGSFNEEAARFAANTIDPTFGLYALNGSGQPTTSAEISAAARARAFDRGDRPDASRRCLRPRLLY